MNKHHSRQTDEGTTEGFRWDSVTLALGIVIVVLLAWLTSELWLPHWGAR